MRIVVNEDPANPGCGLILSMLTVFIYPNTRLSKQENTVELGNKELSGRPKIVP